MFAGPFTRGKFSPMYWGNFLCRKQYHEKCESYSHVKIFVFTLLMVYGRYCISRNICGLLISAIFRSHHVTANVNTSGNMLYKDKGG